MKKIILLFIVLCRFSNVHAQEDCLEKFGKQAVEINKLQNDLKTEKIKNKELEDTKTQQTKEHQNSKKKYTDTIGGLRKQLSELEKFKSEKEANEKTLSLKRDSINFLKKQVAQKVDENKVLNEKSKSEAADEKEKGKKEAFNQIENTYKNTSFDDLINSSSITSVERDKKLIGENTDIKQIIADLEIYLKAKFLFTEKFDPTKTNFHISQVNSIKQSSTSVTALKENLENFKTVNDKLNTAIKAIIEIDKKESVKGMEGKPFQVKLNKILTQLSIFIFEIDLETVNYPYFSDIVLDIIKRKKPNPDTDISDLLKMVE
ncbi:MAG: hypothetical protein K2Q03_04090 [Sphingobacteriaceae bacterium]|nr:hypothetical protein [Sphingobacteriaceae bacterium]